MTQSGVNPYKNLSTSKKTQVALMFNNIARRYDFLNHFLSMGIDKLWRRKAIAQLKSLKPVRILDIATGTGDFAIQAMSLKPQKIVGIDISVGMLKVGREKMRKRKLEDHIILKEGDSEQLEFGNDSFDAVMSAFGVRNFENLQAGLSEMYRVTRPGGKVVVLEFSQPVHFPIKQLYSFYFKNILPTLGAKISSDGSAYSYLPESVYAFPDRERFLTELEKVGFTQASFIPQTFGIACIYTAVK